MILRRAPTEIVQHFAYRGISHKCKVASGHILALSLAYRRGEGGASLNIFLPSFAAATGGVKQHPVVVPPAPHTTLSTAGFWTDDVYSFSSTSDIRFMVQNIQLVDLLLF
jgi:hypothetical protein